MLVDPKFVEYTQEQIDDFVEAVTKPNPQFPETVMTEEDARAWHHAQTHPERPEGHPVGIFWANQLEHNITGVKNRYQTIPGITRRQPEDQDNPRFEALVGHEGWALPPYGVCDNVEQVLARYNVAELPGRKFCIGFSHVFKKDQPPRDGWRWEKWGPYLGTQESHADYIYDEPNIDYVLLYEIYELDEKSLP